MSLKPFFKPFKLSLIQMKCSADKASNLLKAKELVLRAAQNNARVIVLPEIFNSPYSVQYFREYSEPIPGGESIKQLSEMAKLANAWLIGGSIPEIDQKTNKIYNTSAVFNPKGELIDTHRKVHLFDIDVPGKIRFQESEVLSPGDKITTFDTEFGKLGLGICYDIRFPELTKIAVDQGCVAMIFPGAFNLTTGPLHWELLARARAVDNQVYVAVCSPARNLEASYHAWGHSTVVDPWGEVVATTEHDEDIIYHELNPERLESVRESIPVKLQKREDIYSKYK